MQDIKKQTAIVSQGVTNNKQVEADIYDIIDEVVRDTLDYILGEVS